MRRFLAGMALFVMGMFLLSKPVFVRCGVVGNDFRSEQPSKDGTNMHAKGNGGDASADTFLEKKKVALTFDDGPSPGFTDQLLDGLAQRNVKVTFFVMGQKAAMYPELLRREAEEGHTIGNHTYHHLQLTRLGREELKLEISMTNDVIKSTTGREPEFLRPPFGEWDKSMESDLDMIPVFWDVDPLDWCSTDADEISEKIVTKVKENDIILMHDDYQSSVDAALRVIDILTKRGYEFVTVDELIMN